MINDIPCCYTRKMNDADMESYKAKLQRYGEHALIEGEIQDGDVLGLIDDIVTKFDSKMIALEQIRLEIADRMRRKQGNIHIECKDVFVLIDREQGAKEKAQSLGVTLHSLIPFRSRGIGWLRSCLSDIEYRVIKDYLSDETTYQNPKMQSKLREIALHK